MTWILTARILSLALAIFLTFQSVSSFAVTLDSGDTYGITVKNFFAALFWALFSFSMGWLS